MTKKTRRRYTAEFKTAAVARLNESGETFSSVARALGVAATQVDLAPPDRTRSDVCHAAAFMSISAWAWAGVL
jgi:hypothetical protein